jgi:glycosyltransferase involved in cell wall biosynthesis
MKALVVTNMYPTDAEPSFGSFVRDQVESVRRLDVEVEVLAFDGRGDWRAYGDAARGVRRLVSQGDFDVVHAHYGLTGVVALGQRTVPAVVTFHGSDTNLRWQAWVSWLVARLATPIFVSREGANRLGCARAAIIPAGVDTSLFRPRPAAQARAALGWSLEGRYVLLPGSRANPRKGSRLFDAVVREVRRRVPDVTAVSLEGYTRDAAVDVMNAVDVTLLTSNSEGSPVSIKESLACMTPVVSVPVGDLPELLADLPGCAVAPRDPVALADAVVGALDLGGDPELRQRAETYSLERVAARVVELYGSVRRNGPGSRPTKEPCTRY